MDDLYQIQVKIFYPIIKCGKMQKEDEGYIDFSDFQYVLEGGEPKINMDFIALAEQLEPLGIKDNMEVMIKIMYPEK